MHAHNIRMVLVGPVVCVVGGVECGWPNGVGGGWTSNVGKERCSCHLDISM